MGKERDFTGIDIGLLPLQHKDSKVLLFTSSEFQPSFLPVPPMPWKHLGTQGLLGKCSAFHGICLFCWASQRSIYSFNRSGNISAMQSYHGALSEHHGAVVRCCTFPLSTASLLRAVISHNLHWYLGWPYRASRGTSQRRGRVQINCCLMSKAIPWAWGCLFTKREQSKTFSTPNSYRAL